MVTNSQISVTEGSGKNVATYSISETSTKEIQRFALNDSSGAAVTTLPVSLASVPSHAVTNAGTFAVQSTNQANSGVDIGDVTINNSTGAAAVNVQDGGNSLTVDGTVSITANSAVNVAQINGVTPTMSTGASGTGTQRVVTATDSTIGTVTTVTTLTGTTSLTPGTAAGNLGKAEDAAHASGDTGVFALAVRNDGAATSFSGTNADYTPLASDAQGRVYVAKKAPTATLSNVNGSATSVTILASNTARLGASISNDSSALLYVKLGTTASTTSYVVKMSQDDYYEVPFGYTGNIDGIWASATGTARVTELT